MVRFGAKKVEAIPPFLFYTGLYYVVYKNKKSGNSPAFIF